jgi:acylpyruvate hydrolase
MRLATMRTGHGTRAVRIGADGAVETGHPDVGALLADGSWREVAAAAGGPVHPLGSLDYAPVRHADAAGGAVLVTTIAGLGQCRNR